MLLTLSQMARDLRVTMKWLKEEAEAGRVPSLLAGRQRLFNPDAVRSVLSDRAAKPQELSHAG